MRDSYKGLIDYIAERYDCAAEIGVGHFPDVAVALVERGIRVIGTDIKPFLHRGIKVIVDDITQPVLSVYSAMGLLYSLRPPPELVPYMNRVAKMVSADLVVKPLASDYPGGQLTHYGSSTFFLWKFS